MLGTLKRRNVPPVREAMTLILTRDDERMCFDVEKLSSTMSPAEMLNFLTIMHSRVAVWAKVQVYNQEPFRSMRKFMQDKYGKEWWHKVFSSLESSDDAAAELNRFMKKNYSVDINWGAKQ